MTYEDNPHRVIELMLSAHEAAEKADNALFEAAHISNSVEVTLAAALDGHLTLHAMDVGALEDKVAEVKRLLQVALPEFTASATRLAALRREL